MPQPLDAGLFSTVYQYYAIVSFDRLIVFIKASRTLNLHAMSGRKRRVKSSSFCYPGHRSIHTYREKKTGRESEEDKVRPRLVT